MTTLRDALSEAFSKSESGTLEAPTETPIEASQEAPQETPQATESSGRARDGLGRFATKTETPSATPAAPAISAAPPETRKPPSSWGKDYWDHWGKLDPKVQEYIDKREQDYAKGVSTYKSQWDGAQPILKAIEPFMPELQQHGMDAGTWIQNLGNAHRALALGSPEQKAQMFAKLATDYGVDLNALTGQQANPQFGQIANTVNTLQSRLQQFETFQKQQETARIEREIAAFAAQPGHEHFDAVKETMGQLLQSGVVSDLQSAYEKAVRLNDEVWQGIQAKQAQEAEAKRQAELAAKKAAAVSPKSAGPTGQTTTGGAKKGLRDALSEAFDSATTGRF